MSPTKEPPASLSPVESMSLVEACQRKGESKLLSFTKKYIDVNSLTKNIGVNSNV